LDENHYVVDFIALGDVLRAILDELDHRVLLPSGDARIRVTADEREVEATFEDRRWVFPRSDCLLLPIPSTTAELLARYIGRRLLEKFTSPAVCRRSASCATSPAGCTSSGASAQ